MAKCERYLVNYPPLTRNALRSGGFGPKTSLFLSTRSQVYRMAATIQTLQTE